MRVIAGSAKGTRLQVARAAGLRPTGDRQRETLFNVIRDRVEGVSVLDLFAGSGAGGLEALSRGAGAGVRGEADARAARRANTGPVHCSWPAASTICVERPARALHAILRSGCGCGSRPILA